MSMICAGTPAFRDQIQQQATCATRCAALYKDPKVLMMLPAALCVAVPGCSALP